MSALFALEGLWVTPSGLGVKFEPGKALQQESGSSASYQAYEPKLVGKPSLASRMERAPHVKSTGASPGTNRLESELFDARANAKQIAARLSMHLSGEWRLNVYKQVDWLLDVEDWEEGDTLLDPQSMQTFLRFVIHADVQAIPSLGMSPNGHLLAAWRRDTRRATGEFHRNDGCRLVIAHVIGDDPSITTFSGLAPQARHFLQREEFSLG